MKTSQRRELEAYMQGWAKGTDDGLKLGKQIGRLEGRMESLEQHLEHVRAGDPGAGRTPHNQSPSEEPTP